MQVRDLKILTAATLAASATILMATYFIWSFPIPDPSSRQIAKWQPSQGLAPDVPAGLAEQTQLSEALSRPLFRRSRRPFDPTRAAIAEAVPEPPQIAGPEPPEAPRPELQLTVKGILLDGKTRKVLIASPEIPDGIWLSQGAEISGWRIVRLGSNGAMLTTGQQDLELKLYVDNAANTVGSPKVNP